MGPLGTATAPCPLPNALRWPTVSQRVMDEVETQGCDLTQLKDLAPENLAEHWEGITRFLAVIRDTLAGHSGRVKRSSQPRGAAQSWRSRRWALCLASVTAQALGDRRRFDRFDSRHRRIDGR